MQPFLKLNWDISSPTRPEFKLPVPADTTNTYMWDYKFQDFVNPELNIILKNYFKTLAEIYPSVNAIVSDNFNKILFDTLQVFYTPPGASRNIHIDGNGNNEIEGWAINYVLPQGLNEVMSWFKPQDGYTGTFAMSVANTPYFNYTASRMIKIAETPLDKFCLVNVSVPHNVTNNDSRPRYAVSLRSKFLEKKFSYSEMYNFISELQH